MKIMNYTKLRMLLPVLVVITAVFLLSPSVAYAAGNGEAVSPSDAVFDDMEYSETEDSEEDEEVSEIPKRMKLFPTATRILTIWRKAKLSPTATRAPSFRVR